MIDIKVNQIQLRKNLKTKWELNFGSAGQTVVTDSDGSPEWNYDEQVQYVYAGGFTTNRIRKYNKSDLSYAAQSYAYGSISGFVADTAHIYTGGGNKKVYKYLKSDLSKIAQDGDTDGYIYTLYGDDNYVYTGKSTSRKVYKYAKSDLSKVAEKYLGAYVYGLDGDDNYIYVGGTDNKVHKLQKSDLSEVATSNNFGAYIQDIKLDSSLYVTFSSGVGHYALRVLSTSNLSVQQEGLFNSVSMLTVDTDNTYIYIAGFNQKIKKLLKSNLSEVAESPSYGGNILYLTVKDNYVYAGGAVTNRIYKYNKSDLSYVTKSPSYGGMIKFIAII